MIGKRYGGSVTRWGSTNQHSKDVGGFAGDPHTWWLGVDMVYDATANRGDGSHPFMPRSCPACSEEGLKCIHEHGHDHYQPADFPAGPVTTYGGLTS